jgi:hypothetical protein
MTARSIPALAMAMLLTGMGDRVAAQTGNLAGSILGQVSDPAGIGQMGATVQLLNRFERVVHRTLTNERGLFGFEGLAPDVYTVRVSLPSFVPAIKSIEVQPGANNFLRIQLSGMLSSIQLFYSAPGTAKLMSEDYKWVLRASTITRPVLRIKPVDISGPRVKHKSDARMFSDTRGLVSVSAGESEGATAWGAQADLGTAFAVATSLYGVNHFNVSGNVGYSPVSGSPVAGFRTSYRRGDALNSGFSISPEVNLTVRQMYLPGRIGTGLLAGAASGAPALRSMTLDFSERSQITEQFNVEYGFALESVTFVERLNYVSPFVRGAYNLGTWGVIDLGYSSGVPPVELLSQRAEGNELAQDLAALSLFPRVTLRDNRARVQRTQNYELGWNKTRGRQSVQVTGYYERMTNPAVTVAGAAGVLPATDLLPDLNSNASIFNLGEFQRLGMAATAQHTFGDPLAVMVTYGYGGVLRPDSSMLVTDNPEALRDAMRRQYQQSVTARLGGTVPAIGTRWSSSYQVTNYRNLAPAHFYLTQRNVPPAGLNFSLRQPVPGIFGLGRFEVIAEARNVLAQGYVHLRTPDGRQLYLVAVPRALRGGVSFFF